MAVSGGIGTDFNASGFVNETINRRQSAMTINGDSVNWIAGVTVVGIDATKTPQMMTAINDYVMKVKKHLDGINPNASANKAFKGEELQKAVENYINRVKSYCFNLTSQLRAFSDKIADIQAAYNRNVQISAEDFTQMASVFEAGSEYTGGSPSTSSTDPRWGGVGSTTNPAGDIGSTTGYGSTTAPWGIGSTTNPAGDVGVTTGGVGSTAGY